MANLYPRNTILERKRILPLTALVFILTAWGVVAIGEQHVSRLDMSRWGNDLDIPELLAINRYIARRFLPFISVAMVLEGLAFGALCWEGWRRPPQVVGVAVWLVWLLSAGWHGINWLATSFYAA